ALQQVRNELGDFMEEVGRAAVGGKDGADAMRILRDGIKDATEFMARNQHIFTSFREGIQELARGSLQDLRDLRDLWRQIADAVDTAGNNVAAFRARVRGEDWSGLGAGGGWEALTSGIEGAAGAAGGLSDELETA